MPYAVVVGLRTVVYSKPEKPAAPEPIEGFRATRIRALSRLLVIEWNSGSLHINSLAVVHSGLQKFETYALGTTAALPLQEVCEADGAP